MASNTQDYGPILVDVTIAVTIPAVLIFGWRIATRFFRGGSTLSFGWDDAMIICTMIVALCGVSFVMTAVSYGFGRHGKTLSDDQKRHAMLYFWLHQIEYKILVMFAKLAMLFFYIRIFTSDRKFFYVTICFGIFIVAASLAFALANVFQCRPVQRAWDKSIDGWCIDNKSFWISHAAFHIATDLTIFLMPVLPVRKLKMASGKKFTVISAFALGSIVCIADAVRIYYLSLSADSTDPTFGAGMAVVMTTIVTFVALICICIVTGLRRSIISCWRRVRGRDPATSTSYILSDNNNGSAPKNDGWHKSSQGRTTVTARNESEESIFRPGGPDATATENFRPERDIIKKTEFYITDNQQAPK